MTRYHLGPFKKGLVVESPSEKLDSYLEAQGMEMIRLSYVPNEEQLIEELQKHQAQVLFKRSKVPVTRRVIESCTDLMAIQLCCIGDDSIDKNACSDHGVMIFNDPVSNGRSVVELVIGNLITLSRRLYETNIRCKQGHWDKNNKGRFEVLGKTLGILGLGNIGRSVARVAQELGMNILFYDTRQVSIELGKELGWTCVDTIEDLFRQSDCLTVHVSAQDIKGLTNEGLIDGNLFEKFAEGRENSPRIFINFSRGFLHRPEDIVAAIEKGHIRYAAVDVYPHEPRRGDAWKNPYEGCENVIAFPHIGASTQEAQPRIAKRVSETLSSFSLSGAVRDTPFRPRLELSISDGLKSGESFLVVLHSTARGTKRAIDEAIYEAGASNLSSVHTDFNEYGFAYDLAKLDRPLDPKDIDVIVKRARELTGDEKAIRSVRIMNAES